MYRHLFDKTGCASQPFVTTGCALIQAICNKFKSKIKHPRCKKELKGLVEQVDQDER